MRSGRVGGTTEVVPFLVIFSHDCVSNVYDASEDLREKSPQQNLGAMA